MRPGKRNAVQLIERHPFKRDIGGDAFQLCWTKFHAVDRLGDLIPGDGAAFAQQELFPGRGCSKGGCFGQFVQAGEPFRFGVTAEEQELAASYAPDARHLAFLDLFGF